MKEIPNKQVYHQASPPSANSSIAIYAGTFDPITMGHIGVLVKSLKLFSKLIIAVAEDTTKNTFFHIDKRVEMVKSSVSEIGIQNVEVLGFKGLLVDFAEQKNCNILVRGLRALSDFEYEFQLANINSMLNTNMQTIFIPASEYEQWISSSMVKQTAKLGADVSKFVTPSVKKALCGFNFNGCT